MVAASRALPRPAAASFLLRFPRLVVFGGLTVLCLVLAAVLGREMSFDTLNYHLYSGFSALHDRWGQDYFPAGVNAYLLPYAYVPFYALALSGLSGLQAGLVIAAVQSTVLWLTYELACATCPEVPQQRRVPLATCAAVLALLSPLLIQQLGTSFIDLNTALPVVGAWLLIARSLHRPRLAGVLAAGALMGVAAALKLTNAPFALAAGAALVLLPVNLPRKALALALFGLSAAAAFGALEFPWALRLYHQFGNPFFPLLNGIFRSPYFTTEPLHHLRFVPAAPIEYLARPFVMVDPRYMVYAETIVPDGRYALLLVLALAWCGRWLWQAARPAATPVESGFFDARVVAGLALGFGIAWVLWLRSSGNGRYFMPMSCVAAVLLAVLVFRLFRRLAWRNLLLLLFCGVQVLQIGMAAQLRWNSSPWGSGPWFQIELPAQLRSQPNLFLTEGAQSYSFVAPFVHPRSGFINFSGGYAIAPDDANGRRVQALVRQYWPNVRVLTEGRHLYRPEDLLEPTDRSINGPLARLGLRVDPSDCVSLAAHGVPPAAPVTVLGHEPTEPRDPETTYLISCAVAEDAAAQSEQQAGRARAQMILDRVELACPELFQPRGLAAEFQNGRWERLYLNTDIVLWISQGEVKFANPIKAQGVTVLGAESAWARAPLHLHCERTTERDIATVVPGD